jgi:hypothetical protein
MARRFRAKGVEVREAPTVKAVDVMPGVTDKETADKIAVREMAARVQPEPAKVAVATAKDGAVLAKPAAPDLTGAGLTRATPKAAPRAQAPLHPPIAPRPAAPPVQPRTTALDISDDELEELTKPEK